MDTSDRTILKRFILGIVVILLIGVVVWMFFFREDGKKNVGTNKGADTSQQKQGESQPQSESAAGTSATDSHKNPTTQSNDSANSQPTALANTGPGNLVLLFVGAAATGTLAHHVYARRHDNVQV